MIKSIKELSIRCPLWVRNFVRSPNTYSIITLLFSIYVLHQNNEHFKEQLENQIKHDKLSLQPLIDMRLAYLNSTLDLYLKNVGEGPATILSVEFFYHATHFFGVKELMIYLSAQKKWLNTDDTDSTRYGGAWIPEEHLHLSKDEKILLILTEHSRFETQLDILRMFDSIGTRITYLDLYGDTLKRVYHENIINESPK